uniref:Uncharacterized protein n=1 Tax=Ascaris lumbricoides TaxID=6252 RepID=A0A0M3IVA5_ASCLU
MRELKNFHFSSYINMIFEIETSFLSSTKFLLGL